MTEAEKQKRSEQVIKNLLKNPRMAWDERIVMPSDKKVRKHGTKNNDISK